MCNHRAGARTYEAKGAGGRAATAGDSIAGTERVERPPRRPFSPRVLLLALDPLPRPKRYRVAFSGGADSLALLHAFARLREAIAPAGLDALHVNHGLSPDADAWQVRCQQLAGALGVPLIGRRIKVRREPGESPEAAARGARYATLEAVLEPDDMLITAHTEDDQAETLLLQLVRGAGPKGLAAMPRLGRIGRGWLVRPLLEVSRDALREYLRPLGLEPVHDPSNEDPRVARSFVRAEILPRLERLAPGAPHALARAARHQAHAAELAAELAGIDLEQAHGEVPGTLSCAALARLSPARRFNVLRAWTAQAGLPPPASVHLEHVVRDLIGARPDGSPRIAWPGAELRRYHGMLHAMRPLGPVDARMSVIWSPPGRLRLAHGELEAVASSQGGLDAGAVADAERVEVRLRRGGERCRPHGRRHSRSLKKLLQEAGVPPWRRGRLPLIYLDGRLAAVAGLFVCEPYWAPEGTPAWALFWHDDAQRP